VDGLGMPPARPRPPLVLRPRLRGMDAVHAVRSTLSASDGPRILSSCPLCLTSSRLELATRMDWICCRFAKTS